MYWSKLSIMNPGILADPPPNLRHLRQPIRGSAQGSPCSHCHSGTSPGSAHQGAARRGGRYPCLRNLTGPRDRGKCCAASGEAVQQKYVARSGPSAASEFNELPFFNELLQWVGMLFQWIGMSWTTSSYVILFRRTSSWISTQSILHAIISNHKASSIVRALVR